MIRKILSCDICGSKWDITDTDLFEKINPGLCYANDKIVGGCRRFDILSVRALSEDKIARDYMDICDNCYNKIDRFIFDLKEGGSDANI